jgi:hypothetical protein
MIPGHSSTSCGACAQSLRSHKGLSRRVQQNPIAPNAFAKWVAFVEPVETLLGAKGMDEGAALMPDTMADRRVAPRYPVVLIAHVKDMNGEKKFSARTSDLSRTGCYVDTLTPLPKGSSIGITLTKGKETFEGLGTVMYVSPGLGMGVRFEEPIPREQVAVLDAWLERAANQSE